MRLVLLLVVRIYRRLLSPVVAGLFGPSVGCRFHPTCSAYAEEALRGHGAWRGGWLALRRLCRCHPWGGCGHDPVPPAVAGIARDSDVTALASRRPLVAAGRS